MSLTNSQISKVVKHDEVKRLVNTLSAPNTAIAPSAAYELIANAIKATLGEDRATRDNLQQVATGIYRKLDRLPPPPPAGGAEEEAPSRGKAAKDALDEIKGKDKKMAQAVRMVIDNTADGRSAPGATGINHIHVGGNARLNLLFHKSSRLVLGVVNDHMDSKMAPATRSEIDRVVGRKTGSKVDIEVDGDTVKKA